MIIRKHMAKWPVLCGTPHATFGFSLLSTVLQMLSVETRRDRPAITDIFSSSSIFLTHTAAAVRPLPASASFHV